MLVLRVAIVASEPGERTLVLLGLGDFFRGHLVSALDNHAIGSLLEREFCNDLGRVAHQC